MRDATSSGIANRFLSARGFASRSGDFQSPTNNTAISNRRSLKLLFYSIFTHQLRGKRAIEAVAKWEQRNLPP